MTDIELQNSYSTLMHTIAHLNILQENQSHPLMNPYVKNNLSLLNNLLRICIHKFQKIKSSTSTNELICIQAELCNEMHKVISSNKEIFLKLSLDGITINHDEWLQAHCDLATD